MTTPLEEPEAGLAGERTALAWNRSGLAVVVCVAVLVRHAWPLHGTEHEVALGLIAGAVIVWCVVLAVLTLSRGKPGAYVPAEPPSSARDGRHAPAGLRRFRGGLRRTVTRRGGAGSGFVRRSGGPFGA